MNYTVQRLAPSLGAASLRWAKRPLAAAAVAHQPPQTAPHAAAGASRRRMSTFGTAEESPLDAFLHPGAPTPLYEDYEPQLRPRAPTEAGVDPAVLRFQTTAYGRLLQAPYVHPNEHKIVLTVGLADLPLSTDLERSILQEIIGRGRWHAASGTFRLSSVAFGSRIENKRHLVSMLDRLVLATRRLARQVQEEEEGTAVA
jgi:hypothetical protein